MSIDQYVDELGEATGHGWGFLAAYGLTWLVCALAWRRSDARLAAYVTLFQGMVALPLALGLTALASSTPRPQLAGMDALSVVLSCSQLLALPIVILLVITRRYTLVPLAMVMLLVVHFAPYSWLYGTPLYLVMGGVLSLGGVSAWASAGRAQNSAAPARTCLVTGVVMLTSAAVAWSL